MKQSYKATRARYPGYLLIFHSFFLLVFCFHFCSLKASLAEDTVYLTWKKSPSTTMTIQCVEESSLPNISFQYALKKDNIEWREVYSQKISFPFFPYYSIYSTEITSLMPNTEYFFKIVDSEKIYQFKTAPTELNKEIHFVVGGDMYHDDIKFMIKTSEQAAKTNPLFALIGGDIAYAVQSPFNSKQKIGRWIDWLKTWHDTMKTPEGNLVPVITAIGNHDIPGEYNQTPKQAAVFSALFPMPGKQVYNVLDFSDYLSIFILDSGHANKIGGPQTNWLKKVLEKRDHVRYKMAIYHVPAYPSVRTFQNSISSTIRRYWVPLFEKKGIQTVFENHDHAYKRTFPLLKNKVSPKGKGVVYLGDGSWGVEKPRISFTKRKRFYINRFISARHFIKVSLTSTEQRFISISDEGLILDEYIREL